MPLNPRMVLATSPQMYFVDKDTGLPLSAGKVYFYKDAARTILKSVYKITGSPPDYTYAELPNPCTLSGVGTFQDDAVPANDILPYYFPYDGTPDTTAGVVELYYITVVSGGAVHQFDRVGWPNTTLGNSDEDNQNFNFIPNGQFLAHNSLAKTTTKEAGEIRAAITDIAQGGWSFNRPDASAAKDFVVFRRFGSDVTTPTAHPRFSARISNTLTAAADGYKDVRIKFPNVNKFASVSQQYTFAVYAQSNTASSLPVQIWRIKNFGTGGSPENQVLIGTLNFPTSYALLSLPPFVFGSNGAFSLGTLNDDYVQLAFRFPTDSIFDAELTDVMLFEGAITVTSFPITTDADFFSRGVSGWMPTPAADGSNLFLPLVLTQTGVKFDDSSIGVPYPQFLTGTPPIGSLLLDGSKLITQNYSTDGIPYSRLFNKYFDVFTGVPIFGTGEDFFTVAFDGTSEIRLDNNSGGAVTDAADGAVPTGFSFSNIHKINALYTNYYVGSYFSQGSVVASGPTVMIVSDYATPAGGIAIITNGAASAGLTSINVRRGDYHGATGLIFTTYVTPIQTFIAPASTAALAAKWFNLQTTNASATNVSWYVWYQVDGVGVDPAPAGKIGILVNVTSGDSQTLIARKTAEALNGFQMTKIVTITGSSVTAGSYWTATAKGPVDTDYYVWYEVDGIGTDPLVVNRTPIKVSILSTDDAIAVARATQLAINSYSYALPVSAGQFFRGVDETALIDVEASLRYSLVPGVFGARGGTFQYDDIYNHAHRYVSNGTNLNLAPQTAGALGYAAGAGAIIAAPSVIPYGYYESRPYNMAVYWLTRY